MSDEFHRQQLAETTQQLTRDNAAPQVGVHTMSEYIFCRRAGQLAMKKVTMTWVLISHQHLHSAVFSGMSPT